SAIPLGFRPKNIARKIIENPNMNEILFEIENIIYNGDLTYKISPLELMHTEAPLINPSENRPYLLQTLICTTLFYHLGLFMRFDRL
ncbi:hypothetical protein ACTXQV_68020, partial [Klebsiella pneumoniae]